MQKKIPCWQCNKDFEPGQGRMSRNKSVFTCFGCLREWHNTQVPIWKKQYEQNEKLLKQKQLKQMDLFELSENLNTVFQ